MRKRIAASIIVMFMFVISAMPICAADVEREMEKIVDGEVIKTDLSVREKVNENELTKNVNVGNIGSKVINPRIELPEGLLISSVIGTPYGVERATGELFYFPDYQIGRSSIVPPSNYMILGFTVAETNKFIEDLSIHGYDLYAWRVTIQYKPHTIRIPRSIFILDSRGNRIDKIDLHSSSETGYYELDFPIVDVSQGEEYRTVIDGELIAANLDLSAVSFPFSAGLQFNMPIE